MFTRSLAFAALAFFMFVQSGYAVIVHDGAKNDPAWQQEYLAVGQKYDSVVAMFGYDGTKWQNIGSGVVISPNHVIGAAHSALFNNGALFERYGMATGNNLYTDCWGSYETTTVSVIPEYTEVIKSPDMAIWTFDKIIEDVTPATLHRGSDTAKLGSVLDLASFGMYGYPSTGTIALDGAKRGCQDRFWQIGNEFYGAGSDQLIMAFDFPGDPDYQHLGGMSCSYDSGGGWFTDGQLMAVNGYHLGTYQYGSSGGTSISRHVDWIDSVISVPEPSTIVLLATGAAGLLAIWWRRCK